MKTKKGFILIATLFLSLVLLAIITVLTKDAFFQMSKSVVFNSGNEALMLAETGVNKAIFFLEENIDPVTKTGPDISSWNTAMYNISTGSGTFTVNEWNNLSSSVNASVTGSDGTTRAVPAACILVESVGKSENGYKKTVTSLLTYQAVSKALYSSGQINICSESGSNMYFGLDSIDGYEPEVHSDNISSDSISIDSEVTLNISDPNTGLIGTFSTASSELNSTYKSKVTSSGGKVLEDQTEKDYNIDIESIIDGVPSSAYEFGTELENINEDEELLEEGLAQVQLLASPLGSLFGVDVGDILETSVDIGDIESIENIRFAGTFTGKEDDDTLWAEIVADITTSENTLEDEPVMLCVEGEHKIADLPEGLTWDKTTKTLTMEEGTYLSTENDYCIGGKLVLENMSLHVEEGVELYITNSLTLKNVDATCDDNVKIISGGSIIMKDGTFELGIDDRDCTNTEKVTIMADNNFVVIADENPSGGSNYIKGSVYTNGGVIINGFNDSSVDVEGSIMGKNYFQVSNFILGSDPATNGFSCNFNYNPYITGLFLQEKLNLEDLQLQPLFWEVN